MLHEIARRELDGREEGRRYGWYCWKDGACGNQWMNEHSWINGYRWMDGGMGGWMDA